MSGIVERQLTWLLRPIQHLLDDPAVTDLHITNLTPALVACRAGCTTLGQIAQALMARGVKTPSGGGVWHPTQVRRVLHAAKAAAPPGG